MSRIILTLSAFAVSSASLAQGTASQPIPRAQFIAQMDSQFRAMDADKNGQLTRIEIEQYQSRSAIAAAKARNSAQFAELDVNRNGQLSPAEFAAMAAPAPAANAGPMLAREDSNRDSQISLVEHRSATLANFDRLDTDKDGVVTPTEMKAGGIGR
jgi:Ca2+-binding EF-hand superfamily protein